jgi:predicted RNase H-like nuclease (RuvC/YqgF family)
MNTKELQAICQEMVESFSEIKRLKTENKELEKTLFLNKEKLYELQEPCRRLAHVLDILSKSSSLS